MLAQVKPYIYLSDIDGANCKECLHGNNIAGILTVDSEPLNGHHRNCKQHSTETTNEVKVSDNSTKTMFIDMRDDLKTNLLENLPKCFDFIDDHIKRKCNLLVHW